MGRHPDDWLVCVADNQSIETLHVVRHLACLEVAGAVIAATGVGAALGGIIGGIGSGGGVGGGIGAGSGGVTGTCPVNSAYQCDAYDILLFLLLL